MAFNAVVKSIGPLVADGAGAGGATDHSEVYAGLEVVVDRQGSESVGWVLRLPFSAYAGLEAEWAAGVATTVLEAAIASAMGGGGFNASNLTSAQRDVLGDTLAVTT